MFIRCLNNLLVVLTCSIGIPCAYSQQENFTRADLEKVYTEDHNWMMMASIEALPLKIREYLEPEIENLIIHYTEFPDKNWGTYGEWGGWTGFPNAGRTVNYRRLWGISHAVGYSPVSKQGTPLSLHGKRKGFDRTIASLYPNVLQLLEEGRHGDAIRVMGAISHGIQDAATFVDVHTIHRASTFKWCPGIAIPGYTPQHLGNTPDEIIEALNARVMSMILFSDSLTMDIRRAMRENDWERDKELRVAAANKAAEIVADMIYTTVLLSGYKKTPENPFNENLIVNSQFEEADLGEPSPLGWVAHWNNPMDKVGVLDWEGRVERNENTHRSGYRALKLMWADEQGLEWRQSWDTAPLVNAGELYRVSGWAKAIDATGKTNLILCFYGPNTSLIENHESLPLSGNEDWTFLQAHARVPEGACRMAVVLKSVSNDGAVWFDDVTLERLKNERELRNMVNSQDGNVLSAKEPLMFKLDFNEKKGVQVNDQSVYSRENGPNIMFSGITQADLFTNDGFEGSAVEFDGLDDFIECPRHQRNPDLLCPVDALTLSLKLWINEFSDAIIVCKEQFRMGEQPGGYKLELQKNGRLKFTIHTENGPVSCYSNKPLGKNKWHSIVATKTEENGIQLSCDSDKGDEIVANADFRPALVSPETDAPSSLYLGSDTGLSNFFAGKIDDFCIYRGVKAP